MIYHIETRVSG